MALTVELTRLMLIAPIFLALRRDRLAPSSTAQDRFGVAALAPVVLQREHHRGRPRAGADAGHHGVAVGVVIGVRSCHFVVQLPALRGTSATHPVIDVRDRGARETFCADAAAGHRPGRQPDHLPGQHRAGHDTARRRAAVTAYNVAFSVLQIPLGWSSACRWAWCCCRRCRAPWRGRRGRVRQLMVTGPCGSLLWLTLLHDRGRHRARDRRSTCCSAGASMRRRWRLTAAALACSCWACRPTPSTSS